MIAWWTGGAWVLYFADAPTLVYELVTFQAPMIAYIWIGILTFTTYTLAGFMREQVCVYMCPWPRIQAALTDEHALNVTYRYDRGEPRGSVKKMRPLRASGAPAGDCVDCGQCVAVCPTGVDIRKGLQLDCIQCGLCIDACDKVMTKIGRPIRLIGYDTDINVHRREAGLPEQPTRLIRPRTIVYIVMIGAIFGLMAFGLATRSTLGVAALHDRNPMYVQLSDGGVRNAYTVRFLNKRAEDRVIALRVENLPNARIEVAGSKTAAADGAPATAVGPDQTLELRVLISVPKEALVSGSQRIKLRATDVKTGETAVATDNFVAP
jgi:cytochrome c oxidase accessory protein FixG